MKLIKFTVPGEPVGKGRPRVTMRGTYTPEKTARYENLVSLEYQSQCGRFQFPDDAMLDMRIIAYCGIPKSASKKRKILMRSGAIRPTKKPDADNILKLVADSLNCVAYRDDSQIVDCQIRKFYADEARMEIIIKQILTPD